VGADAHREATRTLPDPPTPDNCKASEPYLPIFTGPTSPSVWSLRRAACMQFASVPQKPQRHPSVAKRRIHESRPLSGCSATESCCKALHVVASGPPESMHAVDSPARQRALRVVASGPPSVPPAARSSTCRKALHPVASGRLSRAPILQRQTCCKALHFGASRARQATLIHLYPDCQRTWVFASRPKRMVS
jgi:hypothetical protein